MTAKAAHLIELRTAVNALRAAAGLGAASFSDPTLTPQSTKIHAIHVTQLRTALDGALSTLALFTIGYTDPALTAGTTSLKAAHLMELRGGVQYGVSSQPPDRQPLQRARQFDTPPVLPAKFLSLAS